MPNLLAWSERLPSAAHVIILDLGGVTHIDHNSAVELHGDAAVDAVGRAPDPGGPEPRMGSANSRRQGWANSSGQKRLPDVELAVAQGLNGLG